MATISLKKVSKYYQSNQVINRLDLVIKEGEFFTFVGPSGSGKSTILNMVAGLTMPTSGVIEFDNQPVTNLSPRDRDVAMVFQNYALYPHMSIFENIAFPLKMKRINKKIVVEEVKKVANMLSIYHLLSRKPKQLSGGERQRVALARAIVRKPKVFLMDEPLSNLDARLRIEMRMELKKLHDNLKITTIYVTHDQEEAMCISNRIAVLYNGKMQQCGTPGEVYSKSANTFVAKFIGNPPMNMFVAKVVDTNPLTIECQDLKFTLNVSATGVNKNDKVLVGIRPEDIEITSINDGLKSRISFMEFAGQFYRIEIKWGNIPMKTFYPIPGNIPHDGIIYFRVQPEKCHFFHMESGKRVFQD